MSKGAVSPAAPPPSSRLDFVEVGRGLAALSVVIFHANASAQFFGGPHWQWLGFFEHGVDFFFVLSGFVILHAHYRDLGHRERLGSYAMKRAIRLLPTLWIVVTGWALLRWAAGAGSSIETVIGSLLPYPSLQPTFPLVVWTLRHEIVFYFLFAVLVASRKLGIVLFASWFGLIIAQMAAGVAGHPIAGMPAFYLSGFSLDFLLGMAVYLFNRAVPAKPSMLPLIASLIPLTVIAVALEFAGSSRLSLQDYTSPGATWGAGALGVGFATVLYGLVRLEGVANAPRHLVALGACSYALYLVHTPVNALVQIAARHLPAQLKALGAGHVLLVAAGVTIGWLLYRHGERPMMLWLRRKLGLTRVTIQQHSYDHVSANHGSTPAPPMR